MKKSVATMVTGFFLFSGGVSNSFPNYQFAISSKCSVRLGKPYMFSKRKVAVCFACGLAGDGEA